MNSLLKIVPPLWLLMFLIAGLAVHFFVPSTRAFDIAYPIIGVVLIAAGGALAMHGSALFSKEKTEILPTSATNRVLITYGAYAYSRNPMYLGMVLSIVGVAIWVGSLPLFIATILYFCVLNFSFIPFEEAKMSRIFGKEYDTYRHKVRRWV
jgi:protein-S-isoprenylcysteine O-methyltransferase Ste14